MGERRLSLVLMTRADAHSPRRRTCEKTQTREKWPRNFGPRPRLHGNEHVVRSGWRQAGDGLPSANGGGTRRGNLPYPLNVQAGLQPNSAVAKGTLPPLN